MDHVPTLCALSTVGIAAAGFAFGRSEQTPGPRPSSNKRKAGDNFRSFSSPIDSRAWTPSEHGTPNPSSTGGILGRKEAGRAAFNETPLYNKNNTIAWTPAGREVRSISTPLTENVNPRAAPSQDSPLAARKSSSWLRRLSTSSSFTDNVSRPTTPSISFSNRSTTPILPSHPAHPGFQQPNKLVKRSTSQRALRQPSANISTFRRPATSHQRTAELQQHHMAVEEEIDMSFVEDGGFGNAPSGSTSSTWRPYFETSRSHRPSEQPRKRHTSGLAKTVSLKTINHDLDEPPVLVMATSIAPRLSGDDIDDTEDRPATGIGAIAGEHVVETHPAARTPANGSGTKSRHSFSLGDVLVSGTSGWKLSRGNSLRRRAEGPDNTVTVRHVSSPIDSSISRESRKERRLQRRRNITDPTVFKAPGVPPQLDLTVGVDNTADQRNSSLRSPLPPLQRMSGFDIDLPCGTPTFPHTSLIDSQPLTGNPTDLISTSPATMHHSNGVFNPRMKRLSQAGSDPASTAMGSDGETRVFTSGDEDSMDFQSDTAYDSLATRATVSSHSGLRGPRIETIFDESPPHGSAKEKLIPLEDLIQGGSFSDRFSSKSSRQSAIEESDDDHFSTPMKAPLAAEAVQHNYAQIRLSNNEYPHNFTSSPPSATKYTLSDRVRVRPESAEITMDMNEDDDWNLDDGEELALDTGHLSPGLPAYSTRRVSPLPYQGANLLPEDAWNPSANPPSKRSSIFEWSEQQKSDTANGSSPRPKTVHGKQATDGRGSRTAGRRGPSALHLRSQSVPVAKDPNADVLSNANAGKFGTWGLGNKGVSEEWNDDFEFEEAEEDGDGDDEAEPPSLFSGKIGMRVPQSILDRQASVHIQFGQVQELTLLVEELKRLRTHATALDIIDGPSAGLWKDADGIINLATVDDEDDDSHAPHSPAPASPTFGFDDFEDETPTKQRQHAMSPTTGDGHHRRNSVLRRSTSSPATPPGGRPRGDSVAQAKSFLQSIYQSRNEVEVSHQPIDRISYEKMPFDTQDLRNLVTRAGVMTRALKEIIRKAEGVSQSPEMAALPCDPPFSQIFKPALEEASSWDSSLGENDDAGSTQHGLPKSHSAHGYLGGSNGPSNESDLSGRMKLMTVV